MVDHESGKGDSAQNKFARHSCRTLSVFLASQELPQISRQIDAQSPCNSGTPCSRNPSVETALVFSVATFSRKASITSPNFDLGSGLRGWLRTGNFLTTSEPVFRLREIGARPFSIIRSASC